jgi:hypothetical protein
VMGSFQVCVLPPFVCSWRINAKHFFWVLSIINVKFHNLSGPLISEKREA